jgi:hypothetical protein
MNKKDEVKQIMILDLNDIFKLQSIVDNLEADDNIDPETILFHVLSNGTINVSYRRRILEDIIEEVL